MHPNRQVRSTFVLISGLILFSSVITGAAANAGPSTGGGGFAVVCRDQGEGSQRGEIRTAELLDLYEARTREAFAIRRSLGTLEADYRAATHRTYELQIGRTDVLSDEEIQRGLDAILRLTTFTREGERLPSTNDLGETVAPPAGCAVEQAAVFDDDHERVFIDREIWNAFDTQSRAALIKHEQFFHFSRKTAEQTSEWTRTLVGHMFAARGVTPVRDGVPKDARHGGTGFSNKKRPTSFSAFISEGKTILRFDSVEGHAVLTRTSAEVPLIHWDVETKFIDNVPVSYVKEPNKNVRARVALEGTQFRHLEAELTYVSGDPATLSIYRYGRLISRDFLFVGDVPQDTPSPLPSEQFPPPVRQAKINYKITLVRTQNSPSEGTRVTHDVVCEAQSALPVHDLTDGQNSVASPIAKCPALIKGELREVELIAGLATLRLTKSPSRKVFIAHVKTANGLNLGTRTESSSLDQKVGSLELRKQIESLVTREGASVEVELQLEASYED